MASKQYVVIGLGRFGRSVAETLFSMGHDILAIDSDEDVIQNISDKVTHAVQMDATDEYALRTLGIRNFDVAVVTIGSNVQASIMTTLILRESGVKYIVAKAQSEMHAKVLTKIGADKVILPERDMGVRVAHNLVSSNLLDFIELSPDYSVIEIQAPTDWYGKEILDLDVRSKYGINIMAIKSVDDINISPNAKDKIKEGDVLLCIGNTEDLARLEHMISGD
ncbi:potassium channel family protein [Youngiibacter multivorans]|uniref:Trk system potassium uptake protein TrkA n=1 Tax=Youngiibacter multivorans TaxID=937251 RepID=A0ABS4G2N0_9CLOT|nr:TrkA family potassium uptake protein [Youngiibacter multivorans]MBP1918798.1 trk system potassium uptake protein TrkA [Youngiibacter multivorans]